jgi:hypothetical protein
MDLVAFVTMGSLIVVMVPCALLLFDEIHRPGFPAGWLYAIVPRLNLTTRRVGMEGARKTVTELLQA